MARFSTCSACHRQAVYYCKSCKRLLCKSHVREVKVVYYCNNCEKEVYFERCPTCGEDTHILRAENLVLCDWCNIPTVDALSYVRELPNVIYSQYKKLSKKMAQIWLLTKKYQTTVENLHEIRHARIMLFPDIEDDLFLLKNEIETFIEHLHKFEERSFSVIDQKLHSIQYLRYEDINTIPQAEEVIELIKSRLDVLEGTIKEKIQILETKLLETQNKTDFLMFQYQNLCKISTFIPNVENEQLIAILPRIWVKKDKNLPKKHIVVLTNKNLYLLRERGLNKPKIKIVETLAMSNILSTKTKYTLLFGNIFILKTPVSNYAFFGDQVAIAQLPNYFSIIRNYINFAIDSTVLIRNLKYESPTITKLNGSINTHLRLLNATLLKKTEVLSDIRERKIIDHETQEVINKLQSIQRKIDYLRSKNHLYPSQRGNEGILNKLLREQRRLQDKLEELRRKANKFDEFFDIASP